MPVVTAIKRKVRTSNAALFQIFLDGEFAFTLTDLEMSASGLRVGRELTEDRVQEFQLEAKESKAYALALRYLGVRMRARREVMDYLARKGCEMTEREAALERLAAAGLVDDSKFAQAWIADRMTLRPRSRLRLAQELAAKGVAREVAEAALGEVEPVREIEALKELMVRRRRTGGYADERKLVAYFQRQGYSWQLIKEAMAELKEVD